MRFVFVLMLIGALGLFGCDSDDDGGAGGEGGSAGTGGAGGQGGSAGTGGAGGEGGTGGTTGTEPPEITMVAWEPDGSCSIGVASDYIVTVTATDPDSDPMDLIYDGSVGGCSGQIDGAVSTISCPNAAPYNGTVVVEDGDGNVSIPVNFTIGVCETSSVMP
ncbi:MAG TPA: hypothetical protein VLS88_15080 [Polyangiales bacterium]|nr:hypothetical protein [Polyangiales bacterium]